MNAEEALRSALRAQAASYAASPGAWAENRARVRRRTRVRRLTVGVAVASLAASGAVAVAFTRPAGDRVVGPVTSASASASASPAPVSGFRPPDLRGMDPTEAEELGERCLSTVQTPSHKAQLQRPPDDYRLIFVLPASHTSGTIGPVVAIHVGDKVVHCQGTLDSSELPNITSEGRRWMTNYVEGGVSILGKDGSWQAFGRYTSQVARIEILPVAGDAPVAANLDNGFWFASGNGSQPPDTHGRPLKTVHPVVTAYGHDGSVVYRSNSVDRARCYLLPDGSYVGSADEPTTKTDGCWPGYPWP